MLLLLFHNNQLILSSFVNQKVILYKGGVFPYLAIWIGFLFDFGDIQEKSLPFQFYRY